MDNGSGGVLNKGLDMIREIKFRAWDKEAKEMLVIFDSSNQSEWYLPNVNTARWEIMQYTGLKDRNGVEIYEGDIITHFIRSEAIDQVKFKDGSFMFGDYTALNEWFISDRSIRELEVIGNIYEHPHLLEA